MILEIKEPIKVDGDDIIKNLRLNIKPKDHQFRLKLIYLSSGTERPLDLVVYKWTNPKLDKVGLSIDATGEELSKKISIQFRLSYDFFRKSWKVKGNIGIRNVDRELSSVISIITIMKDFV